jgi:hypothetical protein
MNRPDHLQNVLGRLRNVKQVGENRWQASCPGHDDKKPSLSVHLTEGGKVLLRCHAGCTTEQIVAAAVGMHVADLFPAAATDPAATPNMRPVAMYSYKDAAGQLLYEAVRYEPKAFRQRRPDGQGGWIWNMQGVTRVLYRWPELLQADAAQPVFVVEGEKDVDRLGSIGLTATCNVGGAGKWRDEYSAVLEDRRVIIIPDDDEAGQKHAEQVAQSLHGQAAEVRILDLPGLPEKGDVSDWLDAGHSQEELLDLAAKAPVWKPSNANASAKTDTAPRPQSQADRVLEVAEGLELFHTPGQDSSGFAVVPVGDHHETWRINAKAFRSWLSRSYYGRFGKVPNSQAIQDALNAINGKALFDGPEHEVAVRIAACGGEYWLDLANGNWQAVKITAEGWGLCDQAPVRFIRPRSMLALPIPVRGGSINELRELINVPDDDTWTLVLSWQVQALRPVGPYPIMAVQGEQGSAKSMLCRLIRGLVDPNEAPLRSEPREVRDLMIAASNGWVVAFDNLSRVPPWVSDALCRLSTGGGFATRELYSDCEERIFQATRPVILNGIEELATRSDLLDRTITLTLPTIPEAKRRTESDLMRLYEEARPRILGSLLDAVSAAMRHLPSAKLSSLPRMADFACWATAAEPALGLAPGQFLTAYTTNREGADNAALEASVISPAIMSLMRGRADWQGTVKDLLEELEQYHVDEKTRRNRNWPTGPQRFAGQLRRIAPNLRRTGIDVTFGDHSNRGRMVHLERVGDKSSGPSLILPDSLFGDDSVGRCRGAGAGLTGEPAATDAASDDRDGDDGLALACSGSAREEFDL